MSTTHAPSAPARRAFGLYEAIFDVGYLCAALSIGLTILLRAENAAQGYAGAAALVLAGGDAFHLIPRVLSALPGNQRDLRRALGLGKLVTSISMTAFYALLWHVGTALLPGIWQGWTILMDLLCAVRVALCLPRQNGWLEEFPSVRWGIYRNIPFLLLGLEVAALYILHAGMLPGLRFMGLAIALSFAFYLPVVLWAGKHRMLGMLMLPKTLAYLWILIMFVFI